MMKRVRDDLPEWEIIEGEAFERVFDKIWRDLEKEDNEAANLMQFIICCPWAFKDKPDHVRQANEDWEDWIVYGHKDRFNVEEYA